MLAAGLAGGPCASHQYKLKPDGAVRVLAAGGRARRLLPGGRSRAARERRRPEPGRGGFAGKGA